MKIIVVYLNYKIIDCEVDGVFYKTNDPSNKSLRLGCEPIEKESKLLPFLQASKIKTNKLVLTDNKESQILANEIFLKLFQLEKTSETISDHLIDYRLDNLLLL